MTPYEFDGLRRECPVGPLRISYAELGHGPVAVFLHGVPLNSFHWRDVLVELSSQRRCIAPDLLGLGHTSVPDDQALDFGSQAHAMLAFLDALGVTEFELVGNDSGGAVAQLMAAAAPHRVRSLVLTNCDVHDNWPPRAFRSSFELASRGAWADLLAGLRDDIDAARAAFRSAYEDPARLAAATVRVYLEPVTATPARRRQLDRFVSSMDNSLTVAIAEQLRALPVPTSIVWGDADVFFPVRWAHWLAATLPNAAAPVVLHGARLFFPEERPAQLCELVGRHWAATARA